jgi:hypothetical protein
MDEVCEPENLKQALEHVKANEGRSATMGMTVQAPPT